MTADATCSDRSSPTPLDSDLERRARARTVPSSRGRGRPLAGSRRRAFAAVSYEAVYDGLAASSDFGGSAGQDDIPDIDKNIAAMVEPRHGKVRRIMNSVVAFHKSQQIEPYLQDLVDRLVDGLLEEARPR